MSEILRDRVWAICCRSRFGYPWAWGSKAFVPRPGFEGLGIHLSRGFLTKEHKLGLQRAQIKDVTGSKEDSKGHQQHGRCHPGGGQGGMVRQVQGTFGHTRQADGKVGTRPLGKEWQSYSMGMGAGQ